MRSTTVVAGCLVVGLGLAGTFRIWGEGPPAPGPDQVRQAVRAYWQAHQGPILQEFLQFLSLPNLASDEEGIRRNARFLLERLSDRGVEARLLEAPGAPPAVFGELRVPGATRTVLFYAHYDGQPVNPADWASDPWRPVLRAGRLEDGAREIPLDPFPQGLEGDWRLYARSASDDKGPILALLAALDALRAAGTPPSVHLKFFFEGEEEAGSPHLREILEGNQNLLAADLWILCDGPVHQTGRPQIFFGARGVVGLELAVHGPLRSLHSGHYGNWAPNPAALLVHLLAGLRDPEGKILVAGFYDDVRPLTELEQRATAAMPPVEERLLQELGLAWTEGGGERLQDRIMAPAVNVRGLEAARVREGAANAIPTVARASIDFRLVPDQRPERVRTLVEEHLRRQGFHLVHGPPDLATRRRHPRIVELEWEQGYPAARTPMDLPVSRAVSRVVEAAVEGPLVEVPTLGGSIPMHLFVEILGVPVIGVPMVNHDNHQHAANENLRLQNLWNGIEIYASLMARLGAELPEGAQP